MARLLSRAASALLVAAAAALIVAAKGADPVAVAIAEHSDMAVVRRANGKLPSGPASAVILEKGASSELAVFAVLKGKGYLVHTQPGGEKAFSFDPAAKPFADPFGGKTATLVYRVRDAALDSETLVVLRHKKPFFAKAGEFPEGRLIDADGDGRLDVVLRRRPLGRFFRVGCGDFEAGPGRAFETDALFFDGKGFAPSPARAAAFLEAALKEDEAALAASESLKTSRPGDYLGKALTVYFGHAKLGRKDRGWAALDAALEPPSGALPGVAACVGQVRAALREKLR